MPVYVCVPQVLSELVDLDTDLSSVKGVDTAEDTASLRLSAARAMLR